MESNSELPKITRRQFLSELLKYTAVFFITSHLDIKNLSPIFDVNNEYITDENGIITHGDRSRNVILMTYDDGGSKENIEKIM